MIARAITTPQWDAYLNQAGKLSRIFAMLLDALNRHRGKGTQKITVEHVHGGVQPKSEDQPLWIEDNCQGLPICLPGFGSSPVAERRRE
jgi:hypothetical protein